jgi:hypothetical protein
MVRERAAACNVVRNHELTQPYGRRAQIACMLIDGDNAGALASAAPLRGSDAGFATLVQVAAGGLPPTTAPQGPLDGPAMVMLDLAHVQPPASALASTQPAVIRSLVGHRALPLATRIDIAERGEALPSSRRRGSATSMCRRCGKAHLCQPPWRAARGWSPPRATPPIRRRS